MSDDVSVVDLLHALIHKAAGTECNDPEPADEEDVAQFRRMAPLLSIFPAAGKGFKFDLDAPVVLSCDDTTGRVSAAMAVSQDLSALAAFVDGELKKNRDQKVKLDEKFDEAVDSLREDAVPFLTLKDLFREIEENQDEPPPDPGPEPVGAEAVAEKAA